MIRRHYASRGFVSPCFACGGNTQGFRKAPAVCHEDRILGFLCAGCSKVPADLLPARIRKELDRKVRLFSRYSRFSPEAQKWADEYAEYRRLAEGDILFQWEDPA